MNIMLTNLSLLTKLNKVNYKCIMNGAERDIEGIQTNEAAAKYYIASISENGEKLHKIICLATNAVLDDDKPFEPEPQIKQSQLTQEIKPAENQTVKNQQEKKGVFARLINLFSSKESTNFTEKVSAVEEKVKVSVVRKDKTSVFFKERITKYCKSNNYAVPEIVFIRLGNDKIIPQELINEISKIKSPVLYLDTTGGKRDDVNRLQLIIKFLAYKGVKIKETVYSNLDYSNYRNSSIDNVDIYEIMEVLDGVNQFTDSGQSRILISALKDEDMLKSLFKSMSEFTESIQLCQTSNISKILSDIDRNLLDVEKNLSKKNNKLVIFKQLIPIIRDKFFGTGENSTISIIEWCVKNNLIQQALTIYIEQIPDFLFNKQIFKYSSLQNVKNNSFNTNSAKFYEGMLSLHDESSQEIKSIRDIYDSKRKDIQEGKSGEIKKFLEQVKKLESGKNIFGKFDNCLFPVGNVFNSGKFIGEDGNTKYINFINYLKTSETATASGVIEKICLTPLLMRELSDLYNEYGMLETGVQSSFYRKFLTIRNLEYWRSKGVVEIKKNLELEKAKHLLFDYMFMKAVRNKINHADELDISKLPNDFSYISKEKGITVDNLKTDIKSIIERLKNA